MTAPSPVFDLDDFASLEAADSTGALRSAAMGGAQVRATAAAVAEKALDRLADLRPRSVLLVAASGRAARAASLLVAAVGGRAGIPVLHVADTPPWVGPLDVVVVAGDDPGDPRLVDAANGALRRGAEVVLATPDEGPMRGAGAGRAASLPPRVAVPDDNTMLRFLAIGVAVLTIVDGARSGPLVPDLDELADLLDGEAMRGNPRNEVFRNPAKSLAARMQSRRVVFSGDSPASAALAGHAAEVLLRAAGQVSSAVDLADALSAAATLSATGVATQDYDPLFHDDELDGPRPADRVRVFVLSTDDDRLVAQRRIASLPDADLLSALDDPDARMPVDEDRRRPGRELEQLAVLAVRLEMAAAYLQLLEARSSGRS